MIDLAEIRKDVSKVISFSQDIDDPVVRPLIDKWYAAKKEFINLFGSKLILEMGKIQVNLTEEEKSKKFSDFFHNVSELYCYEDCWEDLALFIESNKENFFDNIVKNPFYYHRKNVCIPSGIKITKAFKFFIEDKEELDRLQTMTSMLLQEEKIEGTLCFSVHPLDYLSSSENNCNWRSCHALDGEYRAGNLSYMLDSSTIICYLKENEDTKIPRFPKDVPWNSKKWRVLLFVSDDRNALFIGRQYPFFSKNLMELIRTCFINNILKDFEDDYRFRYRSWSDWHNDYIKSIKFKEHSDDNFNLRGRYFFLNERLYKDTELIKDVGPSDKLHFNDLLYSSFYEPYYCWKWDYDRKIHFTIGSNVPCLRCGENELFSHDSMLCEECSEDYITCEHCGCVINRDDGIWIESRDMVVCPDCYAMIYEGEC